MLKQRVITAIALLIVVLMLFVYSTPFVFAVAASLVVLMAGFEWTRFIGGISFSARLSYLLSLLIMLAGLFILLGITPNSISLDPLRVITVLGLGVLFWIFALFLIYGYPENRSRWNEPSHIALMGLFVLFPTWAGLIQLKFLDGSGRFLLVLIAMVSIADIGAYFSGTAWGKSKLAPKLSPKKSWAGFWGGMGSCVVFTLALVAVLHNTFLPLTATELLIVLAGSVLVVITSVAGDLFESMLKRNQNLKDSGNLLPGHGGILDRIDSLSAATPFFVLVLMAIIAGQGDT